ncbi:glycosyltransferase [Campylobacter lari]|nr:glycosyltransferase [Campylobacter lari]
MNKLVSVIMPTFNGASSGFLAQSIESVLNQTYKNLEFIIVNDCSTDNTLEILQEYAKKDHRIQIINNQKNQKLPQSLNIGFNNAKGEYFTWTSDDNYFHFNAIEKMVHYLEYNINKILVCCDFEIIGLKGKKNHFIVSDKKRDLIEYDCIGACFLYKSNIAKVVGNYNPKEFKVEDYEYWLRMGLYGDFGAIHENLYTYRFQPQSLTMTAKDGEIANKSHDLVTKFLPLYLKKFPNINLTTISKIQLIILNNDNIKEQIKIIWEKSNKAERRKIYVFLRDRFKNSNKEFYSKIIKYIGLRYRIKFYLFRKKYKI